MPSDRKDYRKALSKWNKLREDKAIGMPAHLGKVAIISSDFTDEPPDTITGMSELDAFRKEALALADRSRARGIEPTVAIDATRGDITRLIQDPQVASIYIIGNGSLSALLLGERDYYDWLNVSEASTHLKQGTFIQRQCGGLTRRVNVPMGLFAVSEMDNVHAAIGHSFYPQDLDDVENDKIKPVFRIPIAEYDDVVQLGSVTGNVATNA